jgi:hypothetical protein
MPRSKTTSQLLIFLKSSCSSKFLISRSYGRKLTFFPDKNLADTPPMAMFLQTYPHSYQLYHPSCPPPPPHHQKGITASLCLATLVSISSQLFNMIPLSRGLLGPSSGWKLRQHGPPNVGILPHHSTASQPRRPRLKYSSPWKPQISHVTTALIYSSHTVSISLVIGKAYDTVWHPERLLILHRERFLTACFTWSRITSGTSSFGWI